MPTGALSGLRILECGDFAAAPYAATLLGHLGADVVKVEPSAGDSNRRRGPYPPGNESDETGGLHLFLDQAKRGVVCDLDSAEGQAEFRRLAATADAVIASGPAHLILRRGITYEQISSVNPRLVVTTITPFGLDAAERECGLPARELCDLAASGWLSISPGALDDAELPPLKPFGQQAHYQAGIHAAIATLGALLARDRDGAGQQIDVSTQAVIVSQLEIAMSHYNYGGRVSSRLGTRIVGPWGMLPLADGLLFLVCVTEDEWQRLLDFLDRPEWADSPLFADRLTRAENNDALMSLIEGEIAGRTVFETYTAMQDRRIPCAPVSEMRDLLENPHLQAREHFVEAEHPVAGKWTYPGAQWQFSATPWQSGRAAPQLGEHTEEVRRDWAAAGVSATAGAPSGASRRLPLDAVRVADFTWAWAGPTCTLQLAHLGADVIKVESSTRLDTVRSIPPFWQEVRGPNRSGYFNQYNQGKRSLMLNLKHPRAVEAARELIRRSDVVVDNFSAGVMERMGLGYEALQAIKPDIIQIELAAHGQTGPFAPYVAYGPIQVPMIGLSSLTGYPGGGPREVGLSYGDPNGGINAALGVLAALHHKQRTGEGQYIDMSQWEAALPLVAEGLLTYQMTGRQPPRMGNRDEFEAPQGVFRCLGEDRWLAISCWSDAEWRALAEVVGRLDLREDRTLATREGRKAREAEIEAAITAWTMTHTPEEAAEVLRSTGVPAQKALTTEDVAHDPTLAARGFWVELPHPECTSVRQAGIPWRFSGTPLAVRRSAPCLGQHTDEVLREVLGMSEADITAMRETGAIE